MGIRYLTSENTQGRVHVEAVDMAKLDSAALDVRLRWLGYGQLGRESLKR